MPIACVSGAFLLARTWPIKPHLTLSCQQQVVPKETATATMDSKAKLPLMEVMLDWALREQAQQ